MKFRTICIRIVNIFKRKPPKAKEQFAKAYWDKNNWHIDEYEDNTLLADRVNEEAAEAEREKAKTL